jgi:hypothetical protein
VRNAALYMSISVYLSPRHAKHFQKKAAFPVAFGGFPVDSYTERPYIILVGR